MLLIGIIKKDNKQECNLYTTWDDWNRDTFSPSVEVIQTILLKTSGKTYAERKEYIRNLAIEFQLAETQGLSWGELAIIQNFFEENGEKYGLLTEFKENCII